VSQGLVSIVLPVHNQADQLAAMVDEYEKALTKFPVPHELVLVANNCRDNTWDICQTLTVKYPNVRAVHTTRGGWGLAVKLGLRETRGDLLCYTNSARTTSQDLVLMLLYATVYPHVVVKANRKIRESLRRRLGSLLYNLECRALFDLAVWDVNGTPKVFPRSFAKLTELTRDDDLIDAEFVALCRREGYPVLEVPIFSTRRRSGESTTGYASAVKMYLGAWNLHHEMMKRDGTKIAP
jgi:glycosyltransferase involved in cell wall biosynthesis